VTKAILATGTPMKDGLALFSFAGDDLTPKPGRRQKLVRFGKNLLHRIGVHVFSRRAHLWHDVRSALRIRACERLGEDALRSGHALIALAVDDDAVTLRFTTGSGETAVRAQLVLACDGSRSTVRELSPDPACLLDQGKSVWRGMAPTVDCGGVATTYIGSNGKLSTLSSKPETRNPKP
jgi:2-polyprenyl-6-methoxyphenol hydroxylase-like FAD-dependent oxidoreductase